MNKQASWVRQKTVCWEMEKGLHVVVHLNWHLKEEEEAVHEYLGKEHFSQKEPLWCFSAYYHSWLKHGHLPSLKRSKVYLYSRCAWEAEKPVPLWLSGILSSTSDWICVRSYSIFLHLGKKKERYQLPFPFSAWSIKCTLKIVLKNKSCHPSILVK